MSVLTDQKKAGQKADAMLVGDAMAPHAFEASSLLKALGHEGRLMILSHLRDGPRTVAQLGAALGASQSVVSSHLARLRYEGLVSFAKDGKTRRYALSDAKAKSLVDLIGGVFCDGLAGHLDKPGE